MIPEKTGSCAGQTVLTQAETTICSHHNWAELENFKKTISNGIIPKDASMVMKLLKMQTNYSETRNIRHAQHKSQLI